MSTSPCPLCSTQAKISGLEKIIEDVYYTCGSTFQELTDNESTSYAQLIRKVFVRANVSCQDHVEVPYYSSNVFSDICVHCACSMKSTCTLCFENQPKVYKRKRKQFSPPVTCIEL